MGTAKKNNSAAYYINVAITLLLIFCFQFLPPFGQVTKAGMQILGIFIGMVYGWSTIGVILPSIMAFLALGFSEVYTFGSLFAASFGHYIMVLNFFSIIFVAYLRHAGLVEFIARWFLSRKACEGHPWIFIFFTMFATYILGMVISPTPIMLFMWSVLYNVCDVCGYERRSKFAAFMFVGIGVAGCASCVGQNFTGQGYGYLIQATFLASTNGMTVSPWSHVILHGIAYTMLFIVYILSGKYLFHVNVEAVSTATHEYAQFRKDKMTFIQLFSFIVMIVVFLGLLLSAILDTSKGLGKVLAMLTAPGMFTLGVLVVLTVRVNGKPLAEIGDLMNGFPWSVYFLLVALLPVTGIFSNDELGIVPTIITAMNPIFAKFTSPFVFIAVMMLLATVLTQVFNNVVTGVVFLTVIYAATTTIPGINMPLVVSLISGGAGLGVATAAASPMSAFMFSTPEWISTKDAYKYTWFCVLLALLCYLITASLLGNLLFPM